jgi:hypothetical protein
VYQAYGVGSHIDSEKGIFSYALDLTYGTSCSASGSKDKIVLAPGSGEVVGYGEGICIHLDRGGSVQLGHVAPTVPLGSRVAVNQQVAKVMDNGTPDNPTVEHIHFEMYGGPACGPTNSQGLRTPFSGAHTLQCVGPLPAGGNYRHRMLERPSDARYGTTFLDICNNSFGTNIAWLVTEGVTGGCGTQQYCPTSVVTREQMAAFLSRYLDLPGTSEDPFTDDETSSFESDINKLYAAGITGGCTATTFCPKASVTREQMAAFLFRSFEDLLPTDGDYFTDDETSSFEAQINRLATNGIVGGCAEDKFCPKASVTREQMAAFLYRGRNNRQEF